MRHLIPLLAAISHPVDVEEALVAAAATVAFVAVMAVISGRLLGVRTGIWRAVVGSVVGCAAGIAGALEVDSQHTGSFVFLAILFGVLGTMIVVVLIEVVAPPHRHRGGLAGGVAHPGKWVRRRLAPIGRSLEVLRHARRQGLARFQFMSAEAISTAEFGKRLRATLEASGGMFVKFGQIASTRGDLLSEAVTTELAELRSSVRPIPDADVRPLFDRELGRPVERVFASVDWEPLAAASIGQTHRAVLRTGERVVVKVQRPGMEELMERDATVLRLVASLAERRLPGARRLGVRDLAEDLIVSLRNELDYLREAAMSERLAHREGDEVHVPLVYDTLSTSRLLVMQEVVGRSVDQPTAVAGAAVPAPELGRRLLRTFLRQVLEEGVYHADPHPGNVFVDREGRLWLLDFGAVGVLDPDSRQSLQEMTLGMTTEEPVIVARAVRRLAGNAPDADIRQLKTEIGMVMVESAAGGFDPKLLRQVLHVMERNGLRVPRSVTQLSRALITLEGTLQTISPGFDLRSEASALIRQLQAVEDGGSNDLVRDELLRALPMLRSMPEHLDEIATQLRAGHLSVRVERFAGEDANTVDRWIDRAIVAVVGTASVVASALLLLGAGMTHSRDVSDALRVIGFIGLVMSTGLLLRSLAQAFQRGRQPR